MRTITDARVGDKVGYNCTGLIDYRGEIVSIGKTVRGGECIVKWFTGGGNLDIFTLSEECFINLRRINKQR